MRGGRYRPGVGRSVRVPQRRSSINNAEEGLVNQDEEERMGLTAKGSTGFDDEKYDSYDSSNNRLSEKLETDEHGNPIYHHGEETFGDILTHPIEELHAHQHRKEDFQSKVGRWSLLQEAQRDLGAHNNSSNRYKCREKNKQYGDNCQPLITDFSLLLALLTLNIMKILIMLLVNKGNNKHGDNN